MNTGKAAPPAAKRSKLHAWMVCGMAMVSFAAGSLLPVRLTRLNGAKADNHRVFELLIYHAAPGKGPALESLFRNASKIMAKDGVNVVGYWVPDEDPAWNDTFIYLVAHASRDEAKKNWQALHADTEFRPYIESAKQLIQKPDEKYQVDEVYMRPTDFSAMR
jgi:SAM-dependent methyltransferase